MVRPLVRFQDYKTLLYVYFPVLYTTVYREGCYDNTCIMMLLLACMRHLIYSYVTDLEVEVRAWIQTD